MMIRWSDLDPLGHVNNAVYFTYFEVSRSQYFEQVMPEGLWTASQGPVLAMASCQFRQEIRYKDQVEVGSQTVRLGRTSFEMCHPIRFSHNGSLAAEGKVVVVWCDFQAKTPLALPPSLSQALCKFEGL